MLLEYGYFLFVNPVFEYEGFTIKISIFKLFESYLVVFILSIFIIKLENLSYPSKIVVYVLFINLLLPISSLYWLQDHSREFFLTISLSFLLLFYILVKTPMLKLPTLKEGKNLSFLILFFLTIIVYVFLIVTGGLQRINFDLSNVYSTREEFNASSDNWLMDYLLPWQAHITNMFLLIYGLIRKNRILVVISLILQISIFAMTGHKSYLFAPILIFGIYYFFKKGYQNNILFFITSALIFLQSTLYILYSISNNPNMLSLFLRRLFYVPAQLHFLYFDFYENMTKYKLSASFLSFIIDNPYGTNPVYLVAQKVFGRDFSPNVGIFGDAYLNFGIIGILLFMLILGGVLKILDSVSKNTPLVLSTGIIIIPGTALVDAALFTSLLTHGILFAIFVIWLTNSVVNRHEKT
ncbi:hypothetical protein HMPREF1210_00706 [Paenisporosarcina sp. HGH0030]|uniref:O-antigen polymerase n=1 Tax=Paenisporosarcina sp. HGH0030 TaxID=1078085 RepID=UPI00034E0967|nr:O-antigen polymerase [Paenisporosarcina sp. HGH0030]EPD53883.1 hypothetical protein HMPREF1210_00706 [Paenisporosarcina sp. HGH0030]